MNLNKKILFIIFLLTIILLPEVTFANTSVTTIQKALIETAKAYYNQKTQLQYDSYKKNLNTTPEDATSKHYTYTVCSGFTYQTYNQTLGIKIPYTTDKLIKYAKQNKNKKNIVLFYFDSKAEVSNALNIQNNKSYFVRNDLFKIYKIQPGDILVYQTKDSSGNYSGHSMLVTNVDEINSKITIMEGGGKSLLKNTEDFDSSGAISQETLSFKKFQNKDRLALIRIINEDNVFIDESGNSIKYALTSAVKSRMKYPSIDIGKIINNVTNQEYATFGDTLTYQLRIRNNSNTTYKNIKVVEYVDSKLTVSDKGTATLSNNTLTWNINSIDPGNYVTLYYSVKIPFNFDLLGKVVVSKGQVDNIATSKIETLIGNKLTVDETNKLTNSFNNSSLKKNSKIERDYINDLYKISLGLDLGISNLKNSDILSYTSSAVVSNVLSVKHAKLNSNVSKYLYSNFYGLKLNASENINKNLVKASDAWNNFATYELYDRARTLTPSLLTTGDIILTQSDNIDKSYIYLKDSLYRKIGSNKFETISKSELESFLRKLIGENYVILRPYIKKVTNIKISSNPTKLNYVKNYDKLDLSGGKLKIIYNDGTSKFININDKSVKVSNFDNSKYGKNTLSITYEGLTTYLDINIVDKKPKKIEIYAFPKKTDYLQNREELDLSEGKLKITYDDNSTEIINFSDKNIKFTGFNNQQLGINKIIVEYYNLKADFNINILSDERLTETQPQENKNYVKFIPLLLIPIPFVSLIIFKKSSKII